MPDIQTVREDLAPFRAEHERAKAATEAFQTDIETKLSNVLQAWLLAWANVRCDEIIASVNMQLLISAETRVAEDVRYHSDVFWALSRTGIDLATHMLRLLEKTWNESWEHGHVRLGGMTEDGACFVFDTETQ